MRQGMCAAMGAVLGLLTVVPLAWGQTIRPVAGDDGVSWVDVSRQFFNVGQYAVINNSGQVLFQSFQSYEAETSGGSLNHVVAFGDLAPGLGGATFSTTRAPLFNDLGHAFFNATLSGTGVTLADNDSNWFFNGTTHVLVAREGSTPPGLPGAAYEELFNGGIHLLTNSGLVGFRSELGTGTSHFAFHVGAPGSPQLVANTLGIAPDTSGETFSIIDAPSVNSAGATVFRGVLDGVNPSTDQGFWGGPAGGVSLIAREGVTSTGTASGVFGFTGDARINESGDVAMDVATSVGGDGVWTRKGSTFAAVAEAGGLAPGAGGAEFESFSLPRIDNSGNTAFLGTLTGVGVTTANDRGVWYDASGSLDLIAREGSAAPGTDAGVVFDDLFLFTPDLSLNANGQIAFFGEVTGTGVTSDNDRGIWATDLDGVLRLIVREGDELEVSPGLFLTIEDLAFVSGSGGGDGYSDGFNDLGEIAFYARFTNNEDGIFVSSLVAVPEPSSLLLAGIGSLGAFFAWRRRRS